MRRRSAAVLLAVALLSAGCDTGISVDHPPVEALTDTVTEHAYDLVPTDVAAAGLPPLTVHDNATITDVTVGTESGTVELMYAMVTFIACDGCPQRKGQVGYPEPMGGRCTDVWPPKGPNGWGPTYRAKGITLHEGDKPSLVLYFRAPKERTVVDEVVVTYKHGAATSELRWQAVRLDLRPKPARAKSTCEHDTVWFGGEVGADRVKPLSD